MGGLSLAPLWALHIDDGMLRWPWLLGGFVVAGALALLAAWRVREEEVPRIALLTAAFFVVSSIHVKIPGNSFHLLLVSLVGIILGRRAPLAILLGVALQALLIPHGGLTAIGVNATAAMLPALACAGLFPLLRRSTAGPYSWPRPVLVALTAAIWGGCLVFAAALLCTNPWGGLVRFSESAGLVVSLENLAPARRISCHPLTLAALAVLAVAAALVERRLGTAPEFPVGAFLGVVSVIGATLLVGLVLVADRGEQWGSVVSLLVLGYLPLALLEGLIVGSMVSFLARVKPEMLGLSAAAPPPPAEEPAGPVVSLVRNGVGVPLLLAVGGLLLSAGPARAHALEAEAWVDRASRRVLVRSFYETGGAPKKATARVLRHDDSVLATGELDSGSFAFSYETAEPLRVQIETADGHHAECRISAEELGAASTEPVRREERARGRDLVTGLAFVLALAAFVWSWSNSRRLRRLSDQEQYGVR